MSATDVINRQHELGAYGPTGRSSWLDVDWRTHQRWVMVNGRPLNLIELGAGPPVLLIHGLSGCWQNWLENICQLSRSHRVIAVDLPGFGHSPPPQQTISIAGYAQTIDLLLAALDVEQAAVIGNSMGGFIGAELAISFPNRVRRLVLVSAAGLSTHAHPGGVRLAALLARTERPIAAFLAWNSAQAERMSRRPRLRQLALGAVVSHPASLPWPLVAEQITGAGKPGFVEALHACINYALRERLGQIRCPTLVIWGAQDRLITVRDAERFRELIPGARKVIFQDTGHMAMLERPAAFNDLVEEFLEKN